MSQIQEKALSRPRNWVRLALFVACGLVVLVGLNIGYQALSTLNQLDIIEAAAERITSSKATRTLELVDDRCSSSIAASSLAELDTIQTNAR